MLVSSRQFALRSEALTWPESKSYTMIGS